MQFILGTCLPGASAFEVWSSDSNEVKTAVINIYCSLDKTNVMQCTISDYVHKCSSHVAVRCQGTPVMYVNNTCTCMNKEYVMSVITEEITDCVDGDIRLIGGQSELEGTLEVCLNGTWGSVCDDYWGYEETGIVCHQLGYTSTG